MRNQAPENFDLVEFYRGITVFQTWQIFPGHVTSGLKDVARTLEMLDVPQDLTGKRVLDIGAWNGFFSFECARRGAAEVVSFGPDDPDLTGFNKTKALLEADNVQYVRRSVYDLNPADVGTFDLVFFLGVIYHLRHPLLALDRIHDVCRDKLCVDTPYIDNIVVDITVSPETKQAILDQGKVMHELPMLYFTGANETGDPYNWYLPNLKAARAMVESSGFAVTHESNDGGAWCWLVATKTAQPFEAGLEGYNPHAARAR